MSGQGQGAPDRALSGGWVEASERPQLLYAVGDVHGCLEELLRLEQAILADAAGVVGEKWLVMLGDYVDRGPASAGVIDHLLAPPPFGFRRLCLKGNHEAMLLEALSDATALLHWLSFGGDATLASYGMDQAAIEKLRQGQLRGGARRQLLAAHLPDEHLEFLRGLPIVLSMPGYIFVHAGLRPGVPLADQQESDLLWIRDLFLEAEHDHGAVVVHGHTPVQQPFVSRTRIGIDTGCFMSGRLTALRIDAEGTRILQS
ncbi:MAG TPA: metallophosphoesterase family protein [Devosiaceae bacterium]|jgi:serine/threonine protein phosphatase 1|nr:metallophosphoesterase family protein [Devosiaceae bacterium]